MSRWRRFQSKRKIPPSTKCFISLLGTWNKGKGSGQAGGRRREAFLCPLPKSLIVEHLAVLRETCCLKPIACLTESRAFPQALPFTQDSALNFGVQCFPMWVSLSLLMKLCACKDWLNIYWTRERVWYSSGWWDPSLLSLLHQCLFTRNEATPTPDLSLRAPFCTP